MQQMKKLSALAAGSMAIGLLLGTSMAQAQEEVCLDGGTMIGIKGLEVVTDEFGEVTIDVDFRYATGFEVYGQNLDGLPFSAGNAEEDAFAVLTQINNALHANNPVPSSVGQPDIDQYYIGVEKEEEAGAALIAAVGGEFIEAAGWEACQTDCTVGTAVLKAGDRLTYADLSRASGGACDGAPGPSFTITPGITGSWYDPERDGEGYNVEIVGSSLDPQLVAYYYTYDADGDQMWLTGVAPADGDTAVVPMEVTSGPVFGDDYDKDDVVREDWGTLTFKFSSCDAGSVMYDSIDFGDGTIDIIRLTSVTGLACP